MTNWFKVQKQTRIRNNKSLKLEWENVQSKYDHEHLYIQRQCWSVSKDFIYSNNLFSVEIKQTFKNLIPSGLVQYHSKMKIYKMKPHNYKKEFDNVNHLQ